MAAFDPRTIAAALRVTGNNQLADELEDPTRQAPQPVPAPPQPVEQPPVQEAAPVEPPPPQQIEDKAWNPNVGRGQLQSEVTQGQNRALDLVEQTGGGKDGRGGMISAEGAERQAELYGQLEDQRKQRNDTSVGRVEGNRAQKDALEKEMFRKLDEISEREKNPPKDVMGMVMGILGAAMTAKGNSGGAVAAQMIGQAMGSKSQQWARELESDKAAIGRMKTMFDLQNDDSDHELDQEQKISALLAGQFDAALKKVGAETESKELRANAEAARNELRSKFAQHQLAVEQKKAAASGSDALWKLSIEQLSSMMANGQLGKEGQAVLTEKIKREQGQRAAEVGMEKDQAAAAAQLAAADKDRAQGSGKSLNVPGLKPLEGATVQDRQEAQKILSAQQQLDSSLAILEKLQGSADANDRATYNIQRKLALGSMNSLANAGVLNPGEVADWNEKFPMHVYDNVSNTVGWNPISNVGNAIKNISTDEEQVLRDMRSVFRGKSDAALRTYNFERDTGTPQQAQPQQAPAAAPAPSQTPSVTMYRRDGTPIQIRADMVDAAKARGYRTEQAAPNLTSGG